jgi:uncharacterized phage protein (predicted DNA packaging)
MLLEDAKKILRLSGDDFDGEISDLIDACKEYMRLIGIIFTNENEADPLIKRAILTYVKAHFGKEDPSSRFLRDFSAQVLTLRDSGVYRGGV